MIPLTERQIAMLRWLDQSGGVSPIIDDVKPSDQTVLTELVSLGLVAEMRNDRRFGGDDELLAWRLLPNPDWNP